MRSQPGTMLSRALRASTIILLFMLMLGGATGYSPDDIRASTAAARIDAPANDAQVDGIVEIRGRATVSDGHFSFYRILIGEGSPSISLRPLGPAYDRPVENGVLGTWDTNLFVSGVYTLTLRVYADDNAFASSSTVVTVKFKPTPTPLAIILPIVIDVPTLVPEGVSFVPSAPIEPPPALDVQLAPFDDNGAPSAPGRDPIATIAPANNVVRVQPIPLDPNNPGPFAVDTPTTYNSGQLPFDPAPIFVTPIDFDPNH